MLPADHPDLANSLLGLAAVYNNQGRPAEAEPVLRRALAIQGKALGADHPRIALGLRNLAALELNLRRPAEAETFARRSLAILEAILPAGDPSLARGLEVLAGALSDQGRGAEAEPLLRRAQEIREGTLGPAADLESRDERRRLAAILSDLGEVRRRLGEPEWAREGWERALELVEELLAEPSDLEARAIAATCHLRLGAVGQARPLVEELLAAGWDDPAFLALCREHGLAGAVANGAASYPTEGGGSSRR